MGVDFKNFGVNYDIEVIDISNNNHQLCSTHSNNFYLEILSENEPIGLITYSIFLFLFIKKNISKV